jgi:flagellum-specific peptidoglycan hydrolase FlgJ
MAQSAFESGYGENIPKGSNNFGGIKYNPNLYGVVGYVEVPTGEYINGKYVKVMQKFAKFKDVQTGFLAHIKLLLGDRYKYARELAKTPEQQIELIVKAGYSTTPIAEYKKRVVPLVEATRDLTELGRIAGELPENKFQI